MRSLVRSFLVVETLIFGTAALIHAGVLIPGYEHAKAETAESVIAFVLVAAAVATFVVPMRSREIGLMAQGFALVGTLIGLFTIAIGVGPRTGLDLTLHAIMVALLVSGCLVVARRRLVSAV